jgi:5-methyltetrahydropteroyltriglutamate--homocysteine methyltransferase
VPDDKVVVLGLVTTKKADLEAEDLLLARVRAASRFVGLDRLAVGTQCGFATSEGGNAISPEAQRQKLALIVRVAQQVFGHP